LTVFYFVPRHTLAEEVAEDFEKINPDLHAAVYRGIERPDPDQTDHAMCHDLELAKAAIGAGQSLETSCNVCRASSVCGYRKQRDIRAEFWVLPNQLAFLHKPDWLPEPTVEIFDEDFIEGGLAGFDTQHPVRVIISTFSAPPASFPQPRKTDNEDRADLAVYRAKLCQALAIGEGPLRREALAQSGLTHADCIHARQIEWRYKGRLELQKNTSREDAISAFNVVGNTFSPRVPLVWELAALLLESDFDLSPNLTILRNQKVSKGEGSADYLQLHWRRNISKSYRDRPTLILDATGNTELLRPYFPNVEIVANVAAQTPNRRIRQITDRSCAKSMFVYPSKPSTAANNVKRLHWVSEVDSAKYRGKGNDGIDLLLVCQKEVETALGEYGQIPGVDMAHFNAVAGINKWKGVAKQTTVGRTLPPPADVEHMAAVLFGKPVTTISLAGNNWWRFPVPIHKRDGTKKYVLTPRHPDPMVEALRWQICEGGLLQTEGRSRAVNRGANDPLDVDILTNVPLPLIVDETTTWNEIVPSPIEMMAARGIVGLDWPTVAVVLPDFFKNKKSVEDWYRNHPDERERLKNLENHENPENSYLDILIGKFGVFRDVSLVKYKIAGNRRSRSALIALSVHPDPGIVLGSLYDQAVEVVDVKEVEVVADSTVIYLEPPFESAKPIPPPVNPVPPRLVVENPSSTQILPPEPGSYEADEAECQTPEGIYRQVVAGMDDLDWLDPETAGAEAAKRWFTAMGERTQPTVVTTSKKETRYDPIRQENTIQY
jgi:putative DNA primase/helicase